MLCLRPSLRGCQLVASIIKAQFRSFYKWTRWQKQVNVFPQVEWFSNYIVKRYYAHFKIGLVFKRIHFTTASQYQVSLFLTKYNTHNVTYAWAFQSFYKFMLKVFKIEEVTFGIAQLVVYFFRVSLFGWQQVLRNRKEKANKQSRLYESPQKVNIGILSQWYRCDSSQSTNIVLPLNQSL